MVKLKTRFVCQSCGAAYPRWAGRCEACGASEQPGRRGLGRRHRRRAGAGPQPAQGPAGGARGLAGTTEDEPRIVSGIAELDRVTGGGFVRGSALLVGGDPGIGKSTLLMQVAAALARRGHRVVYVSGEEAVAQIRLRAAAPGSRRRAGRARRRDQCRGHPRDAGHRSAAGPGDPRIRSRRCGPKPSNRRLAR